MSFTLEWIATAARLLKEAQEADTLTGNEPSPRNLSERWHKDCVRLLHPHPHEIS
jgi:hypothetical protein